VATNNFDDLRSEVLTPVVMKSSVFWDITPCSSLTSYACYMLFAGFLLGLFFDPDVGGDMFLRNVG
jgi:hypothetical protein